MKPGQLRWKWLLFGLLAVLLLGISLIPWLIGDTSRFADRVAEELSGWAGGKVKFTGPVQVSFLPDISIRGPLHVSGGTNLPLIKSMTVKEAKVSLDLVDLLRGKVSIDAMRLQKPRIKARDASHASQDPNAILDDLLAKAPMRVLLVRNGRIDFNQYPIKDFYLQLDAGEETGALSGSGSFLYKNEPVRFALQTGSPSGTGDGKTMPVKLTIDSSQGTAKLAGAASFAENFKIDGTMQGETGNLRDFLNWTDFDLPAGRSLGAFSFAGKFHIAGGTLGLEDGSFTLDGDKAAGVLAITPSPRLRVDGTFAFEHLTLTPFLGDAGAPLERALLGYFDADLRISAKDIVAGPYNLGQGAFTVTAKNGSVTAEIGELELCGGSAEGRINVELAPAAKELSLSADLSDVALGSCLKPFGLDGKLTGTGVIKADLASKGNTLPQVTRNLDGTFVLTSRDGTVALDFDKLSSDSMPAQSKGWQANGPSAYDRLKADCRLAGGRITCNKVRIETPRETVNGTGAVDLPKQTLNWTMTVVKLAAPARVPPAQSASKPELSIRGSLRDPMIRRIDRTKVDTGSLPARASGEQATPR